MSSLKKFVKPICAIFVITSIFATIGIYNLYSQVIIAFNKNPEMIPTRIYADIVKISAPQKKNYIITRLNKLGYKPVFDSHSVSFRLRAINYPEYLLPENHPTLQLKNSVIFLNFESSEPNAPLLSIITEAGKEISEIYLEPELAATLSSSKSYLKHEIREPLQFENIPAIVWKAIIAIEDQSFLTHKGLDPKGIMRALIVNIKTLSFKQGGSTITQQLIKNLLVRRTKNILKKISELFLALLIELKFSKEQILERYLNEVYLGQIGGLEIHGISEGAKYFFSKKVNELNIGEIALMAGLIRGPGYYSPYRHFERANNRKQLVLNKMVETGYLAQEEANKALNLPVRLTPPPRSTNQAPYFIDFVKAQLNKKLSLRLSEQEISSQGFKVYTTLDLYLNKIAQEAVNTGVEKLNKNLNTVAANISLQGALASVDHTKGYIRTLIGGKDYQKSNFNRTLNMKRQIGSTFKPVVYLTALNQGFNESGIAYGSGFPLEDAPWKLTYDKARQQWSPKNYDNKHLSWIPLQKALVESINIPTARLGIEIGLDKIIATAKQLGIKTELPLYPSLILGVAELSPVELLQVYSTLANRGVKDELTVIRAITYPNGKGYARFVYVPKQVYDPAPIDLVNKILENVFVNGTASSAKSLGFHRPAAGKTGTTSENRDSWFAGFTPELTTVTWVGIDKGKSKLKLTGANAALPIWVKFMNQALNHLPETPFPVSENLIELKIDRHSGNLAHPDCPETQILSEAYYIRGLEPIDYSCETEWPISIAETELE